MKFNEKKLIIAALIIILIYFIPYFILGENSTLLIHDNLDSSLAWVKILFNNDLLYPNPNTVVEHVFNGLPVDSVYPNYDFSLIIFKTFGIFWGYVMNKIIMSLVAFFGMYWLLKHHFVSKDTAPIVSVGTALLFALLPFWYCFATVSGLPLMFFAFLNIRKNDYSLKNWLIIIFYGWYSSLILAGFFMMIILGVIFLYDLVKKKKFNFYFILAMATLTFTYILSHYPVFHSFLADANFISHRKEIVKMTTGFNLSLGNSFMIFTKGQYHAHSLHTLLLIPIFGIFSLKYFMKEKQKTSIYILAFLIVTSLFFGFMSYYLIQPSIKVITDMIPIQLQRFHFLHPLFWYILLAISLSFLYNRFKFGKILVLVIFSIQFIYIVSYHELIANKGDVTFKEYYAEETFSKIQKEIGKPLDSFKIISIGLDPAISQYNNFYTLDGYFASYPLSYKHEFRKVIEGELNKDEKLKNSFDNWGSKCYAFSAELNGSTRDNNPKNINNLDYDFEQLKKMGCNYILSTAIIDNSNKLKLITSVEGEYWNIHVYEL